MKKVGHKVYFHWMIIVLSCLSVGAIAQNLKVGLAEENITPPVGYPHYRGISTGVHDSLYAKAIYFSQGGEEGAIISCDLLWIGRDLSTQVRLSIAEQSRIPYQNIIVAATHSHTSPAYEADILELNAHIRGPLPPQETIDGLSYPDYLVHQIVSAVHKAKASQQVYQLKLSQREKYGLSFNRRFFMADGKVKTNPGRLNPAAIRATGPIDPEVAVLWIAHAKGKTHATFVNFANHTDSQGGTEFSADFPGFMTMALREVYGEDLMAIYGQGSCGNLNHVDVTKEKQLTAEEIGHALAQEVREQEAIAQPMKALDFQMRSKIVYAPLQHYTEAELTQAKTNQPFYEEAAFFQLRRSMKIRSLERIRQKEAIPPTVQSGDWVVPCEIQVIQLNQDCAIVGLPGEVFVELGLAIKSASPYKTTMILELTNAHIAYVPTIEGFKQGGYETINSRLAPGGGELMVTAAVELLQALKKQ